MKRCALILAAAAAMSAGPADAIQDYVGSRALGQGGAWRALALDNNAIELNPAGLAQYGRYSFDYAYRRRGFFSLNEHHLSAVDSSTSRLASGVSYTWTGAETIKGVADRSTDEFNVALATTVLPGLSLGMNGSRLSIRDDIAPEKTIWSVDVGALWTWKQLLSVGVVGYNIVNPSDIEAPLAAAAAVAVHLGPGFTLAMDVIKDFTTKVERDTAVMAGGEWFFAGQFFLRGGYIYDKTPIPFAADNPRFAGKFWTAGGGWQAPKLTFTYALAVNVDRDGDKINSINLSVFF